METRAKIEALVEVMERRITEISKSQHALAVEKACLIEQMTPLRLGVTSPDLALAQLRSKGIALRGAATAWASDRRSPEIMVRTVVPLRTNVTPLPSGRSETA